MSIELKLNTLINEEEAIIKIKESVLKKDQEHYIGLLAELRGLFAEYNYNKEKVISLQNDDSLQDSHERELVRALKLIGVYEEFRKIVRENKNSN